MTGIKPDTTFIRKGTLAFRHTAFALAAGAFATFALLYCVQPILPLLADAFGLTATQSSLALSVSTTTLALGMLLTGPVSDAVGRKTFIVAALIAAGLFTLAGAFMPSWGALLATRALMGLALSGLVAVAMTYLSEEIHPDHIGYAMGLYIAGNAAGGLAGRLLSGVLADFMDWRLVVAMLGGASLLAGMLVWRHLPASRNFVARPLNARGLFQGYALHFRDAGLPWLFLEGFLLLGGFVTLFNYIAYRLLEPPFSVSQASVGALSLVYLAGIFGSARVGALGDRLGRPRVFFAMIAMMLAGLLLTLPDSLPIVLGGMTIFTFGFFGAHAVASSWVSNRATQARGQAASLYLFSYYLGSSVAGTLGGEFWHEAQWPGIVLFIGGLLLLALGVALRLGRLPGPPAAESRARPSR